jgi:phage recombination protein Bet
MSAHQVVSQAPADAALAGQFTPEQLKLITDTVAKDATPAELQLFLYRCRTLGFDPLKSGQIHFVKYGSGPGTIVVGIDGFRTRAMRSGKLNGIRRGVLRNDKGACIGAWAEVYRTDWQYPARIEVSLAEYSTGRGPWQKMPETMIQKVAEAAALRMAFPDDLGGVYSSEEMDQAKAESERPGATVNPGEPGPEDGVQNPDIGYRIDFGKWNRRSLEEVYREEGPEGIAGYIAYLEQAAEKKGQKIDPGSKAGVFIREAEAFLGALENGSSDDGL